MEVPFFSFRAFDENLKKIYLEKVNELLNVNQFVLGADVRAFESSYANYCGTSYCKGVGNGLDALTISMKALGIAAGDEVIVPSHTYIATWMAVSNCRATPVPVEVDEATCNIDPALIEEKISPKTKAIIPVHLYGRICSMSEIMETAEKHNLWVIEDVAQAQGAIYNQRRAGSFGHINATSFYPAKNIGALGDGGAVTTNDAALAKRAGLLRNYGSSEKYYHEEIGFNSRLDTIQAIALNIKLPLLDNWNNQRMAAAKLYEQGLSDVASIRMPAKTEDKEHVYHLYVIRTRQRKELQKYLSEKGIGTLIHYPKPAHLQKAYAVEFGNKYHLPIAERLADEVLSLPMFPGITDNEVDYVCEAIRGFYKKSRW